MHSCKQIVGLLVSNMVSYVKVQENLMWREERIRERASLK